jgi:hypothetical protein
MLNVPPPANVCARRLSRHDALAIMSSDPLSTDNDKSMLNTNEN